MQRLPVTGAPVTGTHHRRIWPALRAHVPVSQCLVLVHTPCESTAAVTLPRLEPSLRARLEALTAAAPRRLNGGLTRMLKTGLIHMSTNACDVIATSFRRCAGPEQQPGGSGGGAAADSFRRQRRGCCRSGRRRCAGRCGLPPRRRRVRAHPSLHLPHHTPNPCRYGRSCACCSDLWTVVPTHPQQCDKNNR